MATADIPRWAKLGLALAIGGLGGWIATLLDLPLAWMIGAMVATTAAALAGAPIALPMSLRAVMVMILGVMLGSSFSPAILDQLAEWAVSLAALAAYAAVTAAIGTVYFRRLAGYDRTTAFFSAMPGGLSEMVLVGGELGGDSRLISLVHSARILIVILILPFAFQILLDYQPGNRPPAGPALSDLPAGDIALLVGCAVAGFYGAKALKLPAAAVVGPMVLSAAVHLAGWTEAKPPAVLVAVAQVVIGTAIGCRFAGTSIRMIGRTVAYAWGSTLLLLAVTLAFAVALKGLTGLSLPALVLAYAPGGLAEMSLIAIALSLDAAFVGTHHLVRIFLIVVIAPALFRAAKKRGGGPRIS